MEQSLEHVRPALVPHPKPTAAKQPGLRPFYHPAVSAQSLGGVDATTSDARRDSASPQSTAEVRGVVGLVGMELGGTLARPTRFSSRSDDR